MDGWMSDVTSRLKRLEMMLGGGGGAAAVASSGNTAAPSTTAPPAAAAVSSGGDAAKPRPVTEWEALMAGAASDFRRIGASIGGR